MADRYMLQSPSCKFKYVIEMRILNRCELCDNCSLNRCHPEQMWVGCVGMQFNCFFLMPLVDTFPALLREDLETAFEQDIDQVFDVSLVRRSLHQQKGDLELELRRVCIQVDHHRASRETCDVV